MLKWPENNISGNNFLIFIVFYYINPVANMAANYICIKYISKVFGWKEIGYVDVTLYMGSTH